VKTFAVISIGLSALALLGSPSLWAGALLAGNCALWAFLLFALPDDDDERDD
jgi:hypothetical protein